jgi:hypothetical protein
VCGKSLQNVISNNTHTAPHPIRRRSSYRTSLPCGWLVPPPRRCSKYPFSNFHDSQSVWAYKHTEAYLLGLALRTSEMGGGTSRENSYLAVAQKLCTNYLYSAQPTFIFVHFLHYAPNYQDLSESGGIAPHIHKLGTNGGNQLVTLAALNLRKTLRALFQERLGGPQQESESCRNEKSGIETRFLGSSGCSRLTVMPPTPLKVVCTSEWLYPPVSLCSTTLHHVPI